MLFWVGDGFREMWWCGKEVGRCMEVGNGGWKGGVAAARLGNGWNGWEKVRLLGEDGKVLAAQRFCE